MSAKLIEKVEKLIALTTSSNENEARNAAMLACRLIRENKLKFASSPAAQPATAPTPAARPAPVQPPGDPFGPDFASFFEELLRNGGVSRSPYAERSNASRPRRTVDEPFVYPDPFGQPTGRPPGYNDEPHYNRGPIPPSPNRRTSVSDEEWRAAVEAARERFAGGDPELLCPRCGQTKPRSRTTCLSCFVHVTGQVTGARPNQDPMRCFCGGYKGRADDKCADCAYLDKQRRR